MTCIIGFVDKENDCVWIGADSLGSNGVTKTVNKNPKIFHNEIIKCVIIGGTTSFRHLDLLKYSITLFSEIDVLKHTEIDHKYMATQFIPNAIELFDKGIKDNAPESKGANFIVGVKNKLFEIQGDYSVLEPNDGITAVGCGESHAMGSLYTTFRNTDMTIPKKIEIALEAAEHYCCGVQRPFRIINTKDEIEIIID